MPNNELKVIALPQWIQRFMSDGVLTKAQVIRVEQLATTRHVLKSSEAPIAVLKNQLGLVEIVKPIAHVTSMFIRASFNEQANFQDVSLDFAADIIDRAPTWTLTDVVLFFKFLRRSSEINWTVYGKSINSMKLMELVPLYEEEISKEKEKIEDERRGKLTDPRMGTRTFSAQDSKSLMGKELERVHIKNDGKKVHTEPANEKWFEQNSQPHE